MNFSPQQQAAIDKNNASVVLGAAAGSGKTTVMVNRILRLLKEGACTAQQLLVLTFTRAAASSMRNKLESVLSQEAVESGNQLLNNAVRELSYAQISTFDSFCTALVRRYFFLLDIQADAAMVDENQESQIAQLVAQQTLEQASQAYQNKEFDDLIMLYDVLTVGKQDQDIINVVREVYKHCRLYPDPERRLNELCGKINLDVYKQSDLLYMKKRVVAGADVFDRLEMMAQFADTPVNAGAALFTVEQDREYYRGLSGASTLEQFARSLPTKKKMSSGQFSTEFSDLRKIAQTQLGRTDVIADYKDINPEDIDKINRIYAALGRLVKMYMDNMDKELLSRNVLTFDSAQHYAVKLVDMPEVAAELKGEFKFIFVDEDQDSNRLQRYMLGKIANDTQSNLFMVGDIKQSIYRFRNAEPELFLQNIQDYNASPQDQLHCVMRLNNNFRSHSNVLDCVNLIFKHNMRSDFFQIDYNSDEELVPPTDTEDKKFWQNSSEYLHPTKVVLIKKEEKMSSDEARAAEARKITDIVQQCLGMDLPCKDGVRPAQLKDIVVLHRSANKMAGVYREAFAEAGIPFEVMSNNSMLDSYEVGCILDVLSLIDNRLNDFAMFSAMRLYGFTFDKIISLRAQDKKSSFSRCIINSEDPQALAFIKEIERLRFMSCCRPLWKVIWEIYRTTGFYTRCATLDNGQDRLENLRAFALLAEKYCSGQGHSLHSFLALCADGSMQQTLADTEISGDCVHMMTIHKSKGLEFPIVIVAGCGEDIFIGDTKAPVHISKELGLSLSALKGVCPFVLNSIKRHEKDLERAEQLRNLYVAATRAVNKLIFTGTYKEREFGLDYVRFNASTYFDFILPPLLGHSDGNSLAMELDILPLNGEDMGKWEWEKCSADQCVTNKYRPPVGSVKEKEQKSVDEAAEHMSFEYAYSEATAIPSKMGASDREKSYELNAPDFLGKVSGAGVGSAYHAILEHTDFVTDPEITLNSLVEKGIIDRAVAQKLDLNKLRRFFESPLGKELAASSPVREAEFTMMQQRDGEKYLVQGIIDCFYVTDKGAVLVDFKSDNTSCGVDVLTQKYRPQLETYKTALEKCFGHRCIRASIYYLDSDLRVDI